MEQADNIRIRPAVPEDAEALLAVYAPYILETAITFEYSIPTPENFRARIRRTLERYPYLAAERGGEILGYAYTGPFITRSASDWAAETAIYLRQDARGMGLGRRLYEALEGIARAQNILNLNASIAYPEEREDAHLTYASARFHERMGYHQVARFHRCGYKFGCWYDLIWVEKFLQKEHPAHPAPVIPFPELGRETLRALGVG